MWLSIEEMKILQRARGEEPGERSNAFYAVQAVVDWLGRDIHLSCADLAIAGADPILWALAAKYRARQQHAGTIAVLMPTSFQGAPLAAIHDESFRSELGEDAVPEPSKINQWMRSCAEDFREKDGRIIPVAGSVRFFVKDDGSLFGVADRERDRPRPRTFVPRKDNGLEIGAAGETARSAVFYEQSRKLFDLSLAMFHRNFGPTVREIPPGRRYGDVLRTQRLFMATSSQAHVKLVEPIDFSQIIPANFSISTAASISMAVTSWRKDVNLIRSGELGTEKTEKW